MLRVLNVLAWVPAILLALYAIPLFVVGFLAGLTWLSLLSGWRVLWSSFNRGS